MDDAARVPAIEAGEALADLGASPDPLRHQGETIERSRRIALAQSGRDMGEARVKQEGLRLSERKRDRVYEPHKETRIRLHRAGSVEENDEAQGLRLAPPERQIEGLAAMPNIAADRRAQIKTPAARTDPIAPRQPNSHALRKPLGQHNGCGHFLRAAKLAYVLGGERFVRGRPALASAPFRRPVLRTVGESRFGQVRWIVAARTGLEAARRF